MRPSALGLAVIPLLVTVAHAERTRSEPGRLGQVTGGISRATTSSEEPSGRRTIRDHRSDNRYYYDGLYQRVWRDCPTDVMPRDFGGNPAPVTQRPPNWCQGRYIAVIDANGNVVREYQPTQPPSAGTANVDAFVGLHKVVESNSALSASLAIHDRWFRLGASLVRYQEEQMDGTDITLTLPALTAGVRVTGGGPTRVYLEGGVALVKTQNEPMGDSSLTGGKLGIHAVHQLGGTGKPAVVVDAHALLFPEPDVRALSARLGVRVSFLEVGFRVLDFNVGPALYGPEVGLQF